MPERIAQITFWWSHVLAVNTCNQKATFSYPVSFRLAFTHHGQSQFFSPDWLQNMAWATLFCSPVHFCGPHCLVTSFLFWLLCKPFHNKVPACAVGCIVNGSIHTGMEHLSHQKMPYTSAAPWLCQDLSLSEYIFSCYLCLINVHSSFRVKLKCRLLLLPVVSSSVLFPNLEVMQTYPHFCLEASYLWHTGITVKTLYFGSKGLVGGCTVLNIVPGLPHLWKFGGLKS